MKALTAHIRKEHEFKLPGREQFVPSVSVSMREVVALLSAVTSAVAIIMLSVWASGSGLTAVVGAGTWGISFVFLGMAVDSRKPAALLQLSTGLTLMVLAWLQYTVSPEFMILTGVLMAAWVSVGLFQRLR